MGGFTQRAPATQSTPITSTSGPSESTLNTQARQFADLVNTGQPSTPAPQTTAPQVSAQVPGSIAPKISLHGGALKRLGVSPRDINQLSPTGSLSQGGLSK